MNPKYAIIGGNPFRMYTGTVTYTGLHTVGTANTKEEVEAIVKSKYEDCGGLLLVVDLSTGQPADEVSFGA